jgi:hypothetical protein
VCALQGIGAACNAWTFCKSVDGCSEGASSPQAAGTCSLFYSHRLQYSHPLDAEHGTISGPNVTFTSGETGH